jgi:hypothetical protein
MLSTATIQTIALANLNSKNRKEIGVFKFLAWAWINKQGGKIKLVSEITIN